MADYPAAVYAPRTKENIAGVAYEPAKKNIGFAEDLVYLENEVLAMIADMVGTGVAGGVKGGSATLAARLTEIEAYSPDTSTDHAIVRFDGTDGKTVQNSLVTIDDSNNMLGETLAGNSILVNNAQLVNADWFNTTTLYGWNMDSTTDTAAESAYAGTKFGTSKDLTLKAQKLTASNDVLGNSTYNTIIAGGYLQSTDTVFNVANTADTDDFMVGGWVYIPDITPASPVVLFSNSSDFNNHGWWVYLNATGILISSVSKGVAAQSLMTTSFQGVWTHIIFAREVGVGCKVYLNGAFIQSTTDGTLGTTQSKFQLGGVGGASYLPEAGTRYDECFFKKGVLPTNLDDVVKQKYACSAKKFAVKDANTNVVIPRSLDDGYFSGDIWSVAWSDYSAISTIVGWLATPSPQQIRYKKVGKLVFVMFEIFGTSNSVTTTFTVPYTSADTTIVIRFPILAYDNSVDKAMACGRLPAGSSTVTLVTDFVLGSGWTNSGSKTIAGQFCYEAAN